MKRISKGFTLLELIIAVVILAVLATIAIPTFATDISNSKTAVVSESAAAIARDAEGMADTTSSNGVVPDANASIVAAASEAGYGTVVSAGLSSVSSVTATTWDFQGANGATVCLNLPDTGFANPTFKVTSSAC